MRESSSNSLKSAVKIFLKAKKYSKSPEYRRDKKIFKLFTHDRKLDTPASGDRRNIAAWRRRFVIIRYASGTFFFFYSRALFVGAPPRSRVSSRGRPRENSSGGRLTEAASREPTSVKAAFAANQERRQECRDRLAVGMASVC